MVGQQRRGRRHPRALDGNVREWLRRLRRVGWLLLFGTCVPAPTDAAHVVGQQRRRRLRALEASGAYLRPCDAFPHWVEVAVMRPLYTPRT